MNATKQLDNISATQSTTQPNTSTYGLNTASSISNISSIPSAPRLNIATTLRSPPQFPEDMNPTQAPVIAPVHKEQDIDHDSVLRTNHLATASLPAPHSQQQPFVHPNKQPSPPCPRAPSPSITQAQSTKLQALKGATGTMLAELATLASPLQALTREPALNLNNISVQPRLFSSPVKPPLSSGENSTLASVVKHNISESETSQKHQPPITPMEDASGICATSQAIDGLVSNTAEASRMVKFDVSTTQQLEPHQ